MLCIAALLICNNRLMSNEMTIAARSLRFKKRKSISKKKKA